MKKWLNLIIAATVSLGSTTAVWADTTTSSNNDHAYLYSSVSSLTVGSPDALNLTFTGSYTPTSATDLTIETTLGSLNGQGSTIHLSPTSGSDFPSFTLTSTTAGTATINVYENGNVIGSAQVTFLAGPLAQVVAQVSPSTQAVGGSAVLTINAEDSYGNPVADNLYGTTFTVSTSMGTLTSQNNGVSYSDGANPNGSMTLTTHNGVAEAYLTSYSEGTANVTVSETFATNSNITLNGTNAQTVTLPVNFTYAQAVNTTGIKDFNDMGLAPANELESVRELQLVGVLHGDTNYDFHPNASMKRSEFATMVANYMGLTSLASNLGGTQTKFGDVAPTAWYDGVVAAASVMGYMNGDGVNFHPDQTITYAEVAQTLLNNLGIQTTGAWPDSAISAGNQYGLFNGLSSFSANAPATRGDAAIMVANAIHLVPPTGSTNSSSGYLINTNGKTLETELLGYTWNDTANQVVNAIPGQGTNVGNEIEITANGTTTTLHLANSVTLTGANSINDLMNQPIKYLTNSMGLVTYIEVAK